MGFTSSFYTLHEPSILSAEYLPFYISHTLSRVFGVVIGRGPYNVFFKIIFAIKQVFLPKLFVSTTFLMIVINIRKSLLSESVDNNNVVLFGHHLPRTLFMKDTRH